MSALPNRLRGLLAEFGLVFAQGPTALQVVLADVLEDASNEMNTLALEQRVRDLPERTDAHRVHQHLDAFLLAITAC